MTIALVVPIGWMEELVPRWRAPGTQSDEAAVVVGDWQCGMDGWMEKKLKGRDLGDQGSYLGENLVPTLCGLSRACPE